MTVYRAIRDLSPLKLRDFFMSNSSSNTLGSGMYFSLSYEFSKIFAKQYGLQQISFIGEYELEIPKESLILESIDDIKINKEKILNNQYSVVIKNRELVLKQEQTLNLKSFSIITLNSECSDIFQKFNYGELISDNEIQNVPENCLDNDDFLEYITNIIENKQNEN